MGGDGGGGGAAEISLSRVYLVDKCSRSSTGLQSGIDCLIPSPVARTVSHTTVVVINLSTYSQC